MDVSNNLNLPFIMASQAQKHVTHNEAIRMLDALVNLSATAITPTPPANPIDGERYIVDASPTGIWDGKEFSIAAWQDGAWAFFSPQPGWRCYVSSETQIRIWDGSNWQVMQLPLPPLQNLAHIGINTNADNTNRLSVSSAGTLLTNEGNDHRLVINKAASADTASMIFQTSWTGHAQFGISGDNDFRINVSTNGSLWNDSLVANSLTGAVRFPSGIENPQLHGVLDNPNGFDRLYIDAINGDDTNDGRSKTNALKTVTGLANNYVIGRRLELRLLSDIVFDLQIIIGYNVPQLVIYGRTNDDNGWQNRKITVADSTNNANNPGGFKFRSFTSLFVYRIDVELASTKSHSLFNFYDTIGFIRTHALNLTRTGSGDCSLFSSGYSFVPSYHSAMNVDANAKAYVANGLAAGVDPNSDWRYPCNLNSF